LGETPDSTEQYKLLVVERVCLKITYQVSKETLCKKKNESVNEFLNLNKPNGNVLKELQAKERPKLYRRNLRLLSNQGIISSCAPSWPVYDWQSRNNPVSPRATVMQCPQPLTSHLRRKIRGNLHLELKPLTTLQVHHQSKGCM